MSAWLALVLIVVSVPLAAIAAGLLIVALVVRSRNRAAMTKLQMEEKRRQAEEDRDLLGLGSAGLGPHVEALLERMKALEDRLAGLEAGTHPAGAVRAAPAVPLSAQEDAPAARPGRPTQRQ